MTLLHDAPTPMPPATSESQQGRGLLDARRVLLGQAISGMLFGSAVAVAGSATPVRLAGFAILAGVLSILGAGLCRVVVACAMTAVLLSAVFVALGSSPPSRFWQMSWVDPLAIVLLIGMLVFSRKRDRSAVLVSAGRVVILELAGASVALAVSVLLAVSGARGGQSGAIGYLAPLGNIGTFSYLLENDLWLNIAAKLSHEGVLSASAVGAKSFAGLPMAPFLAFARLVLSIPASSHESVNVEAQLVLRTYFLAMVATPIVVVSVLIRVTRARQLVPVAVAGALVTLLLLAQEIGFADIGHLDLVLLLPLILLLAGEFASPFFGSLRPGESFVTWLSVALLVFVSATLWLPVLPLGAIVLVAWFVAPIVSQISQRAFRWSPRLFLELASLATMEYALWRRFLPVLSQPFGIRRLLLDPVPDVFTNDNAQVLVFVLVVTAAVLSRSWRRDNESANPSLLTPPIWLLAYEAVVMLVEAWTAKLPSTTSGQLSSLVIIVCLAIALVDSASAIGTRRPRFRVLVAVFVTVLFATTAGQGVVYTAVVARWPSPTVLPTWVPTVTSEVSTGARVFCLNSYQSGPDPAAFDAQACSIYAATDAGGSQVALADWLGVIDGSVSVRKVLRLFAHRGSRRWVIVVLGPLDHHQLYQRADPFSRLIKRPGLTFVAA